MIQKFLLVSNPVQIYTKKEADCKFSATFSDKLRPSVSEEGFQVVVCYFRTVYLTETLHEGLEVLMRDFTVCSLVEGLVDFLRGHRL